MIVKNEAHVITRCIESVKRIIDYVLIVDTGSDDGTPEVIENWLKDNDFRGQVIVEPWQNFAYNRSFALEKLREVEDIDYALMIDADEVLVFEQDFNVESFKEFSRYEGVVHEFLTLADGGSRDAAIGFHNSPIQDSARNKSGNKFEKDSQLLEQALNGELTDWFRSRYTFYLAQSYRDSGKPELSLQRYLERADQGFWNEEVYISLYNAGNIMKELGYPKEQVLQTYLRAYEVCPHRVEVLYAAVQYCRFNGMNQQGYILGKHGLNIQLSDTSLFVEKWVYDYGLLDEFSIVAFWAGHYEESKIACERLLSEGKMPDYYRERVSSNLQFAIDRLS